MCLRKQGYWEELYAAELESYEKDGCESEVWFGKGLSRRIVSWIIKHLSTRPKSEEPFRILDVGLGNAFLLITLVEQCKDTDDINLLGIDYSKSSVELSRKLVSERGFSEKIITGQCDFLKLDELESLTKGQKYDLVVDVGTLDAICLLAGSDLEATQLNYMRSLSAVMKEDSIFILASCNQSEDELMTLIGQERKLIDKIETPKLKFGGKEGSQVNCIIVQSNEHTENKIVA